jgi:branched-chain amino acid transport system permease protein
MNLGAAIIDGIREAIGVQGAYYALAAVGLNLQFGYAGLLNFGHVASAMVGAWRSPPSRSPRSSASSSTPTAPRS